MIDPIYDFAWQVRTSGYRWVTAKTVDAEPISGRFLSSGVPWGDPYDVMRYCPLLREPELYRKFAALYDAGLSARARIGRFMHREPEPPLMASFEEAVAAFAGQFGSLTDDSMAITLDRTVAGGEPVNLWLEHVEAMHHIVTTLESGGAQTKGVQKIINKHLEGKVSPRLLWLSSANLARMVLRMVPANLLGAMWLQAARAVDENRMYRPCEMCGKTMEFSRDVESGRASRIDRQTCSEKCRSAHHRARLRAFECAKNGMGVSAIADMLGGRVPVDVIRKWLNERRSKPKRKLRVGS